VLKNALLTLLAVVFSIAVLEIAARWMGLGHPLIYESNLAYGYRLKPDQSAVRLRGAQVSVNHEGLRATADWNGSAKRRVLFVGDSITFGGTYISDQETFAHLACQQIAEASCGNAGTNAYGVDNMVRRLTVEIDRLKPTDLVVTLYYGDALRGMAQIKSQAAFTKPPPGPLLGLMEVLAYGLDTVRAAIRFEPNYAGDMPLNAESSAEATRAMGELFAALKTARDQGINVLMVYSETREQILHGQSGVGALVFDLMQRSGLPLLDTKTVMNADVFYDDVHLEVAGHRLYAKAIAERM
jgi:hypothetical protein